MAVMRSTAGQATVELVLVLPVAIIVGVIAVNALLFVSDCAQFDRVARQAVRTFVPSPAYHVGTEAACGQIQSALEEAFPQDNLSVSVSAGGVSGGHVRVTSSLEFSPTLFGMGLRDQVLGVSMPRLHHEVSLVVDRYNPGVVI